ncbi:MAG: ABC transporter ATP-binding protein [Hyphomicrobiaceae bacterium]|nr:ABC transporter ATP-binding protein [Hyphomicrobiaceae bacterium]
MEQSVFRFVWKHSRREQIAILLLILLSLPFYWASLEIPKRIVNEALQGHAFQGGQETVPASAISRWLPDAAAGIRLDQLQFLFVLSGIYLFLVLVNGAFKYAINVKKGILGERMLRRLRYELVGQFLRFRPEEVRSVKPAEVASMVKDEVEPIGGFIGDAFIQPAFLGTQALTALIFIVYQNVWLGLLALLIVLVQSIVIPILRREQVRLGRERQIASRKFAGRIGEIVEGAPAILTHGTVPYSQAEVGNRLSRLFTIRADLFRRKFAVKFLSNLLSQITPFLFFSVGGYFALTGRLDLGQLVAVIAAYRDLPPPIKELIDWDQQKADVTVKYQQIMAQFGEERFAREGQPPDQAAAIAAPIRIEGLQVSDRLGTTLLEAVTTLIQRPSHIALVGPPGSGRSAFARALGRQITGYKGVIRIGDSKLAEMPGVAAGRLLAFTGADPCLFQGSIRDNIVFSLHRCVPSRDPAAADSKEERTFLEEAALSGNLVIAPGDDWIDYAAAGVSGPDELDLRIISVVETVRLQDDVYRLGLLGRLDDGASEAMRQSLVAARRSMAERLRSGDLERYVEPFHPAHYNANATIGENLVFGALLNGDPGEASLAADAQYRAVLADAGLLEPLLGIGRKIAETTIEMFDGVPAGDPLFERYSFIGSEAMDTYKRTLASIPGAAGVQELDADDQARLIGLALGYIEPRHRFRLVDDPLRLRIVAARSRIRDSFGGARDGAIEFYDPDRYMPSASIRDNLLFGRLAFDLPDAEGKVWQLMREVLDASGLEQAVHAIGLGYDVGPAGKQLDQRQRSAIDLARCLIKCPDVLVMDGLLSAYDPAEGREVLAAVRCAMHGRTLVASLPDGFETTGFDQVLTFQGPRVKVER